MFLVAAAATAAAAITATTAAATTAAAAVAATTAARSATAAEAARTLFARTGFIHDHGPAFERLTIHAIDASLRLGVGGHLDKAKTF